MKINAIITGTTGMVGKGVLLECLDSTDVESVLIISRRPIGMKHTKLKEIILSNFFDLSSVTEELKGYNACFFCLGVSSLGKSEQVYTNLTYHLTTHFADALIKQNPDMTFCYVSGAGTDSTEKGKFMWARVKGRTENAILAMPFIAKYMFRPGIIIPEKGVKSRTKLYNSIYVILKPLLPYMKSLFPKSITTSINVGKAMINVTLNGYGKSYLENNDINIAAGKGA